MKQYLHDVWAKTSFLIVVWTACWLTRAPLEWSLLWTGLLVTSLVELAFLGVATLIKLIKSRGETGG